MTRFGIDALTAIRIAREGLALPTQHKLVAPNRNNDWASVIAAWACSHWQNATISGRSAARGPTMSQ